MFFGKLFCFWEKKPSSPSLTKRTTNAIFAKLHKDGEKEVKLRQKKEKLKKKKIEPYLLACRNGQFFAIYVSWQRR